MAKAKRGTKSKAKAKRANKDTSLPDRRAIAKAKAPKAKKEKPPKPPKPTLFETIGESPVKIDKPDKLTNDILHELDCCFEGINWQKEFCPRGFPMDEKKMVEVMMKPGASISFETSWPAWVMNTYLAKAMISVEIDDPDYPKVQAHCALILKSFLKEERERQSIARKHIAAGIGSAREMHIDLCRILIKHYVKL